MSSHMTMPKEGHMEAVLHVFVFLCREYNSRMDFDPDYTAIIMGGLKEFKWKYFYGELKGAIPPNAPEGKGE